MKAVHIHAGTHESCGGVAGLKHEVSGFVRDHIAQNQSFASLLAHVGHVASQVHGLLPRTFCKYISAAGAYAVVADRVTCYPLIEVAELEGYSSDESGVDEIYVIPFPRRGERRQISSGGGREPRWAKNGRDLFYRRANSMMSVEISTDPAFRSGTPRELFAGPYDLTLQSTPNYDVSADGQRFLMIRRAPQETPLQLNFVLNWFEELKQKVPVGK